MRVGGLAGEFIPPTQGREEKAKTGLVREDEDSKDKEAGAEKSWGQVSRNRKWKGWSEKEGRKAVWRTAAL